MDRRALPGIVAGVVGGVAGAAAVLTGDRLLGMVALMAALVAVAAVIGLGGRLRRAERDTAAAVGARVENLTAAGATIPTGALPIPVTNGATPALAAAHASTPMTSEANMTSEMPESGTDVPSTAAAHADNNEASDADAADLALAEAASRGPESVFDNETGLLDERVFVVSFERKVAAARRHLRPLCLVLIDVSTGLPAHPSERNRALQRFGAVVRETLRDADIACRLSATSFGLILEDTPEAGGVWAAERLQIALACQKGGPKRLAAAVAAYPNHGLAAQDVLQRAQDALIRARASDEDGMGPVEVAISDLA